ncbi:MAG TPA: hypothetical protein VF009_00385 [Solirubrobacterales bacterium]
MSRPTVRQRVRARAARSPRLRRLAGKPPRFEVPPAGQGLNASAWKLGDEAIWPLLELYGDSFPVPPISYGTVRDFADSVENMPGLASDSYDMKDMQRCWAIKVILGNVPRGSRILEIGAGEPLVAGILARLGYEVTVVDPYRGEGNGPFQYKGFRQGYPDLHFVRDEFPPKESLGQDFAAVYSISVLEHVPLEALEGVITAARRLTAAVGGLSIHAIDLVLAGWGTEEHLEKLERIVAASGLAGEELRPVLDALEKDPETYFVSAEAHNRWRGGLDYDDYPMRRIVSVNLCTRG